MTTKIIKFELSGLACTPKPVNDWRPEWMKQGLVVPLPDREESAHLDGATTSPAVRPNPPSGRIIREYDRPPRPHVPPTGWIESGVVPYPIGRTYTQTDLDAAVATERERRLVIASDLQEYIYRVGSQVSFEHAEWAQQKGMALLRALRT